MLISIFKEYLIKIYYKNNMLMMFIRIWAPLSGTQELLLDQNSEFTSGHTQENI